MRVFYIFFTIIFSLSLYSAEIKKGQTFVADQDYKIITVEQMKDIMILKTKYDDLSSDYNNLTNKIKFLTNNEFLYQTKIKLMQEQIDFTDNSFNKIAILMQKKYDNLDLYATKLEKRDSNSAIEKKVLYGGITFTFSLSIVSIGAAVLLGYMLYVQK